MITEKDLQEAIAECEGQRNPSANTCIKLAAFYTIRQHMFGEATETYSFAPATQERENVEKSDGYVYDSGTEFSDLVMDMDIRELMPIVDELMSTIQIVQPRLYDGVMRKLKSV